MTYQEFLALMDTYTDAIVSATICQERERWQEQLDAKVEAIKMKDALWEAIRSAGG